MYTIVAAADYEIGRTRYYTVRTGIMTEAYALKVCSMLNEHSYANGGDGEYEVRRNGFPLCYFPRPTVTLDEEIPW